MLEAVNLQTTGLQLFYVAVGCFSSLLSNVWRNVHPFFHSEQP